LPISLQYGSPWQPSQAVSGKGAQSEAWPPAVGVGRVGIGALSSGQQITDKADIRALSIRQPYAELILRGTCGEQIKPIEFRSRQALIIGQRF